VVWAPDMKVSLTQPRESRTNPIFEQKGSSTVSLGEAEAIDKDKFSADAVRTTKRAYNKTGKHTKDPNYWKKGCDHEMLGNSCLKCGWRPDGER